MLWPVKTQVMGSFSPIIFFKSLNGSVLSSPDANVAFTAIVAAPVANKNFLRFISHNFFGEVLTQDASLTNATQSISKSRLWGRQFVIVVRAGKGSLKCSR